MAKHLTDTLFTIQYDRFIFDDIDNVKLAQEILEQQNRVSNNPDTPLFEDTVFNPMVDSVGAGVYNKFASLFDTFQLKIYEHWTQIHQPLESTSLHKHGSFPFAFVYYVKVPEGAGNLIFDIDSMISIVQPVESNMLIFPGLLMHRVSKNLSTDIRISWSGNLGYK